MVTKNYSVIASADDCDETSSNVVETADTLMILNMFMWGCGIRFQNIDIPQGTQITSAELKLTGSASSLAGDTDVYGVDADNTSQWTAFNKPSTQTQTTASTAWDDPPGFHPDAIYATWPIDVTAIVQEILDRGGFSSGNAMSFVIEVDNPTMSKGDHINIHSYDHASYPEPKLKIIYQSPTKTEINIGDDLKGVAEYQINIGDVWKDITELKINIGDVWKDVF